MIHIKPTFIADITFFISCRRYLRLQISNKTCVSDMIKSVWQTLFLLICTSRNIINLTAERERALFKCYKLKNYYIRCYRYAYILHEVSLGHHTQNIPIDTTNYAVRETTIAQFGVNTNSITETILYARVHSPAKKSVKCDVDKTLSAFRSGIFILFF